MTRLLFVLAWILLPATLTAAGATLASLEGEVTVLRSGVLVPSEKLSDGFSLEAFDTVTTGATGRAEVRFAPAIGVAGLVRMDAGTSLYLDFALAKREQTVGVELLTGAVSVQVSSVTGSSLVEVRTAWGTFFGPGPSFRVVSYTSGDLLVTSAAGRVVCRLPLRTVFVEPGSVVQLLALDDEVKTLPMNVTTLGAFETTWLAERRQVFKDQAALVFRSIALRYQLEGARFQRAWERFQREGMDDERGFQAATTNLRSAAAPLERSLFQIRALRALLEEGGLQPSVELSRGYAAKDFFRQAILDDSLWSGRLGQARGFYRTLADRMGGSFPRATAGLSVTWSTDFFH